MSPSVSIHFLQTQSDARLLALARRGHERAFEALVHRYRKSLLAYCRRLLLPEARAEDALQQALLQAWIALERGDDVKDARAWLFRIAHNASLNALRGSRYDYDELSESLVGAQAPESDLDRRIAIREALAGLAALPPLQREALLRTAVEGRPHEEVAAAMGLSDAALRGLVYRARSTMRSAVTAMTPPSLVAWVASAGAHGGPFGSFAQRLPEVSAGGGSVGVIAVLVKGGAVAVTAGALVVGATAVREHRAPPAHATVKSPARSAPNSGDAASQAAAAAASIAGGLADARGAHSSHGLNGKLGSHAGGAGRKLAAGHGDGGRGLHAGDGVLGDVVKQEHNHVDGKTSPSGDHGGTLNGNRTPSGSGGSDGSTSGGGHDGSGGSGSTTTSGRDGSGSGTTTTTTTTGSDGSSSSTSGSDGGSTPSGGSTTTTTSGHDGSVSTDGGSSPSTPSLLPTTTTTTAH
jgi:RNA polymerase sigma factor (sigma-70 family)